MSLQVLKKKKKILSGGRARDAGPATSPNLPKLSRTPRTAPNPSFLRFYNFFWRGRPATLDLLLDLAWLLAKSSFRFGVSGGACPFGRLRNCVPGGVSIGLH